ncbi:hypothetical protein HXA34_11795 [Salipaludibacillus agaradhaerens]|uniref:hypothetical protein n=1 Tax=Salipaludibacillus agaradhaerens TaxID=76935 RepID=UPI002150E602|nr:hypothetical protein [Salipaludibacillus agaradhaerens]MCR6106972.1 hypothetical protein [Salipaludibacillus agaradhaerens]MCR6119004.1 hypothetical protein [Salipaludibacillus agaradhaerens]
MKYLFIILASVLMLMGCSESEENVSADTNNEEVVANQDEKSEEESNKFQDEENNEVIEEENDYDEVAAYNSLKGAMEGFGDLTSEIVEGNSGQSHVFEVFTDGMVKFITDNVGTSNFMVHIEDGVSGDRISSVANHVGDFSGHQYLYLDEGEYIMQVTSNGDWSIEIEQPFISEILDDRNFSGVGSTTIGPIVLSETRIELVADHSGDGNFMVHVLDVFGDRLNTAFNEIGEYEGNHITTVEPNWIYYIDVTANGEWNLELKE